MPLSKELLGLLACPVCKGELSYERESLLCAACGLRFPVQDGIPVLLVEAAQKR